MSRKSTVSGRNFGWGKQMGYAGHNAIQVACNNGKFGSVAAHSARWQHFCRWSKSQGIRDVRHVSVTTLQLYADYLIKEQYSASYAQNLLSSCNVVLEALREDRKIRIAPIRALGSDMRRSHIRDIAPHTDLSALEKTCVMLRGQRLEREATVIELCRHFGLRSREAALLDCKNALIEQSKWGKINIILGTKGGRGRFLHRWVPAPERTTKILKNASELQGSNRNLTPVDKTCHKFLAHVRSVATDVLKAQNIKSLHELRAAYACERYAQITGSPAPCIAGSICPDRSKDIIARETISGELGHGRIDVIASYIGGRS